MLLIERFLEAYDDWQRAIGVHGDLEIEVDAMMSKEGKRIIICDDGRAITHDQCEGLRIYPAQEVLTHQGGEDAQ